MFLLSQYDGYPLVKIQTAIENDHEMVYPPGNPRKKSILKSNINGGE
jgi:hypothetical protein